MLDTDLGIYWLKDANYALTTGSSSNTDGSMTWLEAEGWIDSLNNANHLGFNDWRLPGVSPVNGVTFDITSSCDGSTDNGYNITSPASELSYMYHVNLGNLALYDTECNLQPGFGLKNTGPFINIVEGAYWTEVDHPTDPDQAFVLGMGNGHQDFFTKDSELFVWAVRDAPASVPLPAAVWLFGTGLLGLFGIAKKSGLECSGAGVCTDSGQCTL